MVRRMTLTLALLACGCSINAPVRDGRSALTPKDCRPKCAGLGFELAGVSVDDEGDAVCLCRPRAEANDASAAIEGPDQR
jgi:hypothetical protein